MCFLISLLLPINWLWFQFDTRSDPLLKRNDLQRFRSFMAITTTQRHVDARDTVDFEGESDFSWYCDLILE